MSIVQKITKIDMFFGHRFWMALEGVLEGLWEAKNLDVRNLFREKIDQKRIQKSGRRTCWKKVGKKLLPEALGAWARDQGDYFFGQGPCWGGRGDTTN